MSSGTKVVTVSACWGHTVALDFSAGGGDTRDGAISLTVNRWDVTSGERTGSRPAGALR